MSTENQYAERDAMWLDQQGGHYVRHLDHMTREGLHSKSDIAAELGWRDYQISELSRQVSALQTSQDNIINELGIKGDGPYSKLVLEKFIALQADRDALAAENTYLLPKAASELSNAWLLHRTMMGAQAALKCLERGDYSATREWLEGTTDEAQLEIPDGLATGELQKWFDENLVGLISNSQAMKLIKAETPATDAAIANTQAGALYVFANAAEEQLAKGKDKADVIDTVFNLGAEAMISMLRMSANALRAGRKG